MNTVQVCRSMIAAALMLAVAPTVRADVEATAALHADATLPNVEAIAVPEAASGVALGDAELESEAGNPLIVVILVRGTIKVAVNTCSKSPSTCSSIAADIAKKAGGAVVFTALGRTAVNTFCKSRWSRYASRVCN